MGDVTIFDIFLIFSRVLCIQRVRYININDLLGYEQVYHNQCLMRLGSLDLKTKLHVELTFCISVPFDAIVLDRSDILWIIRWPCSV